MKFCLNFRTVLASSACAIIFLPAAATAQSQTESAEPAPVANSAVMDDIVVTARRTAENIQSTPVSVTAFSGDMLRQSSIRDTQDLLRSEEHTSELQSPMRISDAVLCLK